MLVTQPLCSDVALEVGRAVGVNVHPNALCRRLGGCPWDASVEGGIADQMALGCADQDPDEVGTCQTAGGRSLRKDNTIAMGKLSQLRLAGSDTSCKPVTTTERPV